MRPKGWKLDPKWIKHYADREAAYIKRRIEVMQMEFRQQELNAALEDSMRKLKQEFPPMKILGLTQNARFL